MNQPTTIDELIESRGQTAGDDIAFWKEQEFGQWIPVTAQEFCLQKRSVAHGLLHWGLQKGDVVGIIASSRYEWELADKAVFSVGLVSFGIDVNLSAPEIEAALKAANVKCVFIENEAVYNKIPAEFRHLVIAFDAIESAPAVKKMWELIEQFPGTKPPAHASPEDYAIIVETSGTTGNPKLIRFRHQQILAGTYATAAGLGLRENVPIEYKRTIGWLPLAYMTSKVINLIAYYLRGEVYFLSNPKKIIDAMVLINPSHIIGVPIFYERIYEGIQDKLRTRPVLERMFFYLILFLRRRGIRFWGTSLVENVHNKIFGNNIKFLLSGSAPLRMKIMKFFLGLDLVILEGYAMSENAIPLAMNQRALYKFGTVGKPVTANELKFSPEGEILVKGPGVFEGYMAGGGEDGRSFDADGYLRTGDIGHFDNDGFLVLTGRIKEMIKTANGYRISPVEVEETYKEIPYIRQIVVVGDNQRYLGALIVLDTARITEWCRRTKLFIDPAQYLSSPEIHAMIKTEIERVGASLAHYKRIRNFVFLSAPLSLTAGEITPNLKLRRKVINEHYRKEVDSLFKEEEKI